MDFSRASILKSRIPLNELYNLLSLNELHTTDYKNGILLFLSTPNFMKHQCNHCSKQRVSCVLTASAYILHDAGDAILAEWVNENLPLSDTILKVIQCAFKLIELCKGQRNLHSSNRPFQIAISAGKFARLNLKHEGSEASFVIGPAVDELRSAVALEEYGNVIISPEAWLLCNELKLKAEYVGNEGAVRVRLIRQTITSDYLVVYNSDIFIREYPMRAYLITSLERHNIFREFMTKNVLDKICKTQECQKLLEIWPATIMFVNVQFVHVKIYPKHGNQKLTNIITNQMLSCGGELCSIFLFHEGCIFLCIVGVPGDTTQDKTTLAVCAARRIHQTCLRKVTNISTVSVGLTTGRVSYYQTEICLRKKYHMYGKKVNLAAKLTLDYPGIVSCDVATRLYSMLPFSSFMHQRINDDEEVHYEEEVLQMFADDCPMSVSGIDGRRLALAHMQTMLPDEQLVVKYASVIGHTFSIDMLQHILPYKSIKDLTIPLKSLVNAGILKCASIPSNTSSTETCSCKIDGKVLVSAPVWPCQLMKFCSYDEMEMVCSMVKKNKCTCQEIHKSCARYLEKKIHCCTSCKREKFLNRHKSSTFDNYELVQQPYTEIQPYEIFCRQGSLCQSETYTTEGDCINTKNFLGKVKLVLTADHEWMTDGSCECPQLVKTILIPKMRHWQYAGNVPKTFYYLLECAAARVYLQNNTRALEFLTEARSILDNLKEGKAAFPTADSGFVHICIIQQAFMYRLTGEILYKAAKILEAEANYKKALRLLDCELPSCSAVQCLKLIQQKRKKHQYLSRQFELPKKDKLACLHECIICLSYLWQIGCMRGQFLSASLAMTMEIDLTVQSADTFKILYTAIDYFKYSQFMGKASECKSLEAFLCRICPSMPDHPEGLRLISHLTQTLAVVKLCTGNLKQSIECTIQAQQLSEILNGSGHGPGPRLGLDVRTTAALHLPLLFTDRHKECVQQVLTLEKLSKEEESRVAKGWFYAACMNLLLYAGFAFRPFKECFDFVEKFQSDADLHADKSLMLRLYSAVALWYARLEDWEKFAVYFNKARKVNTQIPSSIESINGVVMFLECNVLFYRKELTECNRKMKITLKRTQKFFSEITKRYGRDHIFAPRVHHLIAYMHQLNGNKSQVDYFLKDALFLCKEQGNLLEQRSIKQSQVDLYGVCKHNPAEWAKAVMNMPSWEETEMLQPEQLQEFCFHLKNVATR